MSKQEKPQYKYNAPGRCPKCNHRTGYEGQCASMPPSIHCPICGWRDFDMTGMRRVNWELLPAR